MTERIIITAPREGVAVGGRFDGWRMRQHPDGQWVSVAKLEAVSPFSEADGVLGMLFAERRAKSEDTTPTPAPEADVAGLVERLRNNAESWRRDDALVARDEGEGDLADEAADRIEALQAKVAFWENAYNRRTGQAIEARSRAETAEASLAAARDEVERMREALAEIANAYTAHGYADAMDAVQNLKDTAKGALK